MLDKLLLCEWFGKYVGNIFRSGDFDNIDGKGGNFLNNEVAYFILIAGTGLSLDGFH